MLVLLTRIMQPAASFRVAMQQVQSRQHHHPQQQQQQLTANSRLLPQHGLPPFPVDCTPSNFSTTKQQRQDLLGHLKEWDHHPHQLLLWIPPLQLQQPAEESHTSNQLLQQLLQLHLLYTN
jgi:hypothetical protein